MKKLQSNKIIIPSWIAKKYSSHRLGLGKGRKSILYEIQQGECYWHQFGECHYKGKKMLLKETQSGLHASFEHLKEVSKGGDNSLENIVLAHRKCNTLRNRKNEVRKLRGRLFVYFGMSYKDTAFLEYGRKDK